MANTATLKSPKPQAPQAAAADAPTSLSAQTFAMLSHRGRVRRVNQDACAALPEIGAFVVCDGIGGAAAGEVASHLASEAFLHALSDQAPAHARRPVTRAASPSSSSDDASPYPPGHPHTRLYEAVRAANQAVFRHSRKSPSLHGMGTTLVSALLDHDADTPAVWLAHVGDSRCYRLRGTKFQLLTRDHSLVEEQVRAGTLSPRAALASPLRNIITRAVGSRPSVEPDIASHTSEPGDLYLLASDGLTRELSDTEIARYLLRIPTAHSATNALEAACQTLVDAANARGGRDNITVLLVSCP
jgi:serine/threonine protein phosphatase PrpC